MKKSLACLSLSALLLTGCVSVNNSAGDATGATTTEPSTSSTTAVATPSATSPEPSEATTQTTSPDTTATSSKLRQAFTGTTLKGNDIGFAILDPAEQISLNEQMKGIGFEGSWGVLCSQMAVVDQLKETGVETTNNTNGDTYTWRSIKYAAPEKLGAGEDTQLINEILDAASAQTMQTGHNCAMMISDDPVAMMGADTATVGRYMGGGQIIDRAEIH